MFAAVAPSSPIAFAVLIVCFVLVLAFEFSNGFHDTANAVATVIYTHSLKPVPAVLLVRHVELPGRRAGWGRGRLHPRGVAAAGRADAAQRQPRHRHAAGLVPRRADLERRHLVARYSLFELPTDAVYHVNAELKTVSENKAATAEEKATAKKLHDTLHGAVEYAPVWVRMLSAICLGFGTMIGYRRIVTTIGERIGKRHLTPAQGASAEPVGGVLIGTEGFSGLPVSTTHIISSGVAGTMAGSGAGVQKAVVWQIIIAWVATLPATILLSGGLFWMFSGG